MPLRAIITGGKDDYAGTYLRIANRLQDTFGWTVTWESNPDPSTLTKASYDVLLHSVDVSSHGLTEKLTKAAQGNGLMVHRIERKWSRVLKTLTDAGYDIRPPKEDKAPVEDKEESKEDTRPPIEVELALIALNEACEKAGVQKLTWDQASGRITWEQIIVNFHACALDA